MHENNVYERCTRQRLDLGVTSHLRRMQPDLEYVRGFIFQH